MGRSAGASTPPHSTHPPSGLRTVYVTPTSPILSLHLPSELWAKARGEREAGKPFHLRDQVRREPEAARDPARTTSRYAKKVEREIDDGGREGERNEISQSEHVYVCTHEVRIRSTFFFLGCTFFCYITYTWYLFSVFLGVHRSVTPPPNPDRVYLLSWSSLSASHDRRRESGLALSEHGVFFIFIFAHGLVLQSCFCDILSVQRVLRARRPENVPDHRNAGTVVVLFFARKKQFDATYCNRNT